MSLTWAEQHQFLISTLSSNHYNQSRFQVQDIIYFIMILLVVMMAFGVVRQSITYPDEEAHWLLVRNIFLKPYFMIYGEVYAGEIDGECL